MIKQNIPILVAKEMLAHSDIKITMQYTHVDSLDVINAMNVLNAYSNNSIQNDKITQNTHEK